MVKFVFGLVLSTAAAFSFAGAAIDVPVEIDMEARTAMGNMKTARFSDNKAEQIGCGTRTFGATDTSPGFTFGFCQAQVVEGESVICFAYDKPDLIDQMKSVASFSYVGFRWDEEGNCTYVATSTQSQYIPSKKFKD
ncbi:hypothetical protein [Simiduia agarivorans]|uniref:Uncharacterized protein n=1 Tax=Simiduia agarivorans (strain DSM 21679 / JCM 13881 / BCRC 17597 / SA1) TaxID=1117647 RepID=K4KMA2_SIMAS|nr:hypothetical protein [Simiduia agarivorans]AFU99198.1 hypothetical protein M5M_10085 [Simiduia agarivorans SA1 = DSM 21679]